VSATAFLALLEAGDIAGLQKAWAKISPHLPRPETREAAEIVMHHARTQNRGVTLKARAWSHRWLIERSLPSGLPDELKPKAERMYPVIVDGVGIVVKASNPRLQPLADEVRREMEVAVADAYADGNKDPAFVKARMEEAKSRTYRTLLGR
jgi:hypothetical protein